LDSVSLHSKVVSLPLSRRVVGEEPFRYSIKNSHGERLLFIDLGGVLNELRAACTTHGDHRDATV
jgi:hypothetical protein